MQARRKGKYILFPWDVALCFSSFVFVHVKYMMYRAGEPEEQEEEEEEEKKKEGKLEEGGRFKTLDDEDRERFSWENNYNAVRLLPRW